MMLFLVVLWLMSPIGVAAAQQEPPNFSCYLHPGFDAATDSFPSPLLNILEQSIGESAERQNPRYHVLPRTIMQTILTEAGSEGILHARSGADPRAAQDSLVQTLRERTPFAGLVIFYWRVLSPSRSRSPADGYLVFVRAVNLADGVQAAMQFKDFTPQVLADEKSIEDACAGLAANLFAQLSRPNRWPVKPAGLTFTIGCLSLSAGIAAAIVENQVRRLAAPSRTTYILARTPDEASTSRTSMEHAVERGRHLVDWRNGLITAAASGACLGAYLYGRDVARVSHRPHWVTAVSADRSRAVAYLSYRF